MRIHVDERMCTGHGVCEGIAEDLFEVAEDGIVRLLDAEPGDDRRADVEAAVAECPARALRIEG